MSARVGLILSILAAFLLAGCYSVKMYPICFYRDKPNLEVLQKDYVDGLKKSFSAVIGGNPDRFVVSPDVRWIVATTTDSEDADLLRMWPRIGCIGPAGSTSLVQAQKDCIEYVQEFIKSREYTILGQYRDAKGGAFFYNESKNANSLVYCANNESVGHK